MVLTISSVHGKRFEELIRQDRCWSMQNSNYWNPLTYVNETLKGIDVSEIEVQGALQVKKKKFQMRSLSFHTTRFGRIAKTVLVGRGTDSAEVIA